MPANQNIAPIQQSGVANVPYNESTGAQYQGADISDNLVFPWSGYQPVVINNGVVFAGATSSGVMFTSGVSILQPGNVSGTTQGFATTGKTATAFTIGGAASSSGTWEVGQSGGGTASVAVVWSGAPTVGGSGGTLFAAGSGVFCPVAFFFVQAPTSGNPIFKVPLFNS